MRDAGLGDGRLVHVVALLHPRRRPAARMPRDAIPRLAGLGVKADGDHRLRTDLEIDRVGVDHLSRGNRDRVRAVERKTDERLDVNLAYAGLPAGRQRNRSQGDGKLAASERVGYLQANPVGANRRVKRLAERRLLEHSRGRL